MTWLEFKTIVREQLHVHSERAGIQPMIERKIRVAVIDIQRYVLYYREGHETSYQVDDFTTVEQASVAALPDGAMPISAEYQNTLETAACDTHPLDDYPFDNVRDLICGNAPIEDCRYYISIDHWGKTFYVFPSVEEGYKVVLKWDGLKCDFEDTDEVPFDEPMAEAVAEYVLISLSGEIDKNIQQREEHKAQYARLRRTLYTDARERRRMRGNKPSPYPKTVCAPVPVTTSE